MPFPVPHVTQALGHWRTAHARTKFERAQRALLDSCFQVTPGFQTRLLLARQVFEQLEALPILGPSLPGRPLDVEALVSATNASLLRWEEAAEGCLGSLMDAIAETYELMDATKERLSEQRVALRQNKLAQSISRYNVSKETILSLDAEVEHDQQRMPRLVHLFQELCLGSLARSLQRLGAEELLRWLCPCTEAPRTEEALLSLRVHYAEDHAFISLSPPLHTFLDAFEAQLTRVVETVLSCGTPKERLQRRVLVDSFREQVLHEAGLADLQVGVW